MWPQRSRARSYGGAGRTRFPTGAHTRLCRTPTPIHVCAPRIHTCAHTRAQARSQPLPTLAAPAPPRRHLPFSRHCSAISLPSPPAASPRSPDLPSPWPRTVPARGLPMGVSTPHRAPPREHSAGMDAQPLGGGAFAALQPPEHCCAELGLDSALSGAGCSGQVAAGEKEHTDTKGTWGHPCVSSVELLRDGREQEYRFIRIGFKYSVAAQSLVEDHLSFSPFPPPSLPAFSMLFLCT